MVVECVVSAAGAVWGVLVAMMAPGGGGAGGGRPPPPPPGTGPGRWVGNMWQRDAAPSTAVARFIKHGESWGTDF